MRFRESHFYRLTYFEKNKKKESFKDSWGERDLNPCRHSQQIYSLSPLTTRPSPRFKNKAHLIRCTLFSLKPAKGIEPSTCWLQVSCSTDWAKPANDVCVIHYNLIYVKYFFHFFLFFFALKTDVVFRRKFFEQILYQRVQFVTGRKLWCRI